MSDTGTDAADLNHYDPFALMQFDDQHCFLCGTANEITQEHIFPKWLLQRLNLYNEELVLLNGTSIPYYRLTIPCCKNCNGRDLQRIETSVCRASAKGYRDVQKLDPYDLWLWLSKIFFGLLFRELSLLVDRKNISEGSITTPEMLERFRTLHGFLQAVRMKFNFQECQPFSLFVLKTRTYEDVRRFDYYDSFPTMTFAVRFGDVGIIGALQDNGAQQESQREYFSKLKDFPLHPLQFAELYAKCTYAAGLMNRTPKYVIKMPRTHDDVVDVLSFPVQGQSVKPIFDDWDQKDYAAVLAGVLSKWGFVLNDVFQPPDRVRHFVFDHSGKPVTLPLD